MQVTPPSRRRFLEGTGALFVAGALGGVPSRAAAGPALAVRGAPRPADGSRRLIVSTWDFGRIANEAAWSLLAQSGCHPFEAAEAGARVAEADPSNRAVGRGGLPNAEGVLQLDAALMRGDTLDCGAVAALSNFPHPVSVARAVMERTPHVLLVGEGAAAFARGAGFAEEELLSEAARAAWEKWVQGRAAPAAAPSPAGPDDHDTLGLIVLAEGRFGVAMTTSGMAFKLPGRVGDSPLVGAGLYCDDGAGAAVATGNGEEMIRTCASFAVVEAMRRGEAPEEACRSVLRRVQAAMAAGGRRGQVALLAVDGAGQPGAAALESGFRYALRDEAGARLVDVLPLS